MTIINENVTQFEAGKKYIFVADKIEAKQSHKWINFVDGMKVNVKLQGLGYVIMNHPTKGIRRYTVLPRFCVEVA